jgi:antitoxin MazE
MIKKLTTIGHSLGIILDRPVLDLLNINRDTELTVTTDGDALILRPVRPQDLTLQPLPELRRHSRLVDQE